MPAAGEMLAPGIPPGAGTIGRGVVDHRSMTRSLKVDLRVYDAGGEEIPDLCRLFTTVFQANVSPEAWSWKYRDPALEGHANMVLAADDRILGHAGAIIMPGRHDGHPVPMAQICDVMLTPEVRGGVGRLTPYHLLMAGLIDRLHHLIPDGLYFGFPGARPFRLGERLGLYRRIGPIEEYLRPAERRRWGLWHLVPLPWGDPRLDALWQRHISRPGCRLVRDRRYLGWRYARNPHHDYLLLGLRHGWSLVGWVVVSRQGDEVLVVDRCCDEDSMLPILCALGHWAWEKGASRLAWWRGDGPPLFPPGTETRDTLLIGGVMPASAPRFADCTPTWQPGDTDVR